MSDKNNSTIHRINKIITIALAIGGGLSLLFSVIDLSKLKKDDQDTDTRTATYALTENPTEGDHVIS